jgi:hypothetical protein
MPTLNENLIDLNLLKQELKYDPETGLFFWIKRKQSRKKGWFIGSLQTDGYAQIFFEGKYFMAHRIAWMFCKGDFPFYLIDHINRNPADNRIANLREANFSQNSQNTKIRSNNKSGFKGVYAVKNAKKWRVQMKVNKKQFDLGYFDTPELASQAYQKACHDMHTHKVHEDLGFVLGK